MDLDYFKIQSVANKFNLVITPHPDSSVPLAIVNYHHTKTKRNHLTDQLRGICFNVVTGEVVAKSINRFSAAVCDQIEYYQSKEDGTMIMYYWVDSVSSWIIQCRHNFADDLVPTERCTYKELFLENFPRDEKEFNKEFVYMFELCTPDNRIVQKYLKPALFLLAITKKSNQFLELDQMMVDLEAERLGLMRPAIIERGFLPKFYEISPLIEGFVGISKSGTRTKFKNPFYRSLSCLKYRGWFQQDKAIKNLLTLLSKEELEHQLIDLGYSELQLEYLEKFRSFKESNYCCPAPEPRPSQLTGISKERLETGEPICTCGAVMKLKRLKKDWLAPSYCHCGKIIGVYRVYCGKLLFICDDCNNTHEAHQSDISFEGEGTIKHSKGEPLGYPCTRVCKIYRLQLHSKLDPLWRSGQMTKSSAYDLLAQISGLNRKSGEVHIAKFGITDSYRCIRALEKMI